LSLSPEKVPPSSSPSPHKKPADTGAEAGRSWIVVVEDNPADVGLVREALDEHRVVYELTVITDGERAIGLIEDIDANGSRCPDLVLLDLKLPRRDGCEVLQRMRASAQCRNMPVVVLTSSDAKEDRECAERYGATKYLRKPHSLEEFIGLGRVFIELLAGR